MKKFFSLVAIAAVAATMFTSCDKKDDPTPPVTKAKLVLSAASNSVAVDAEGTFTVTSDIAAPEAIVVTVKSSAEATLTVDPASVTIPKGEKTATGKFKGVADGKATITIASTADVTITTPSVEITVGTPPVPGAQIQQLTIEPADGWNGFLGYNEEGTIFFNFYEVSYDGGAGMNSICMDLGKGNVMGLGELNANGFLGYKAQAAGTAIKFDDMISPEKDRPVVWSSVESMTSLATGQDVYIVFAAGDFDTTSDDYRVWAKINLGAAGGWSSLQVLEAYACLNDGEFKVGQKE